MSALPSPLGLTVAGAPVHAAAELSDRVLLVARWGGEWVVCSVRALTDSEWSGGRYLRDREAAMRLFAEKVADDHAEG